MARGTGDRESEVAIKEQKRKKIRKSKTNESKAGMTSENQTMNKFRSQYHEIGESEFISLTFWERESDASEFDRAAYRLTSPP
jgi:hypothetical protein